MVYHQSKNDTKYTKIVLLNSNYSLSYKWPSQTGIYANSFRCQKCHAISNSSLSFSRQSIMKITFHFIIFFSSFCCSVDLKSYWFNVANVLIYLYSQSNHRNPYIFDSPTFGIFLAPPSKNMLCYLSLSSKKTVLETTCNTKSVQYLKDYPAV